MDISNHFPICHNGGEEIDDNIALDKFICDKSALVETMAWCQRGTKPLSVPMITQSSDTNSAVPLQCGSFSHKYSQKTPHSSPVRASYGVSFVNPASDWYSSSVPVNNYVISYNNEPSYNGTSTVFSALGQEAWNAYLNSDLFVNTWVIQSYLAARLGQIESHYISTFAVPENIRFSMLEGLPSALTNWICEAWGRIGFAW